MAEFRKKNKIEIKSNDSQEKRGKVQTVENFVLFPLPFTGHSQTGEALGMGSMWVLAGGFGRGGWKGRHRQACWALELPHTLPVVAVTRSVPVSEFVELTTS